MPPTVTAISAPWRSRLARSLAIAGFAVAGLAATLAVHGRWTLVGIPTSDDLTLWAAPLFAARSSSEFSLWWPNQALGLPLDANFQFGALDPARMVFHLLRDWRDGFGPFLLAHCLLAFAGAALLARATGLGGAAAFVAAFVFACGGHMQARPINVITFLACCRLPWALTGAVDPRARGAIFAFLGWWGIGLSGSPHVAVYGGIAWVVAWWMARPRASAAGASVDPAPPRTRFAWRMRPVHAALGVIAAGNNLVPGLAWTGETLRSRIDLAENLADSLRWGELATALLGGMGGLVRPEVNDKTIHVGAGALLSMALALALRERLAAAGANAREAAARSRRAGGWSPSALRLGSALVLVGVAIAMGDQLGWQAVLPHVPVLRWIAGPARALVLAALGMGLIAGAGFESLLRAAPSERRRALPRVGVALSVATAIAFVLFAIPRLQQHALSPAHLARIVRTWALSPASLLGGDFPLVDLPLGMALALGALALASAERPRLRRAGELALVLAVALPLVRFAPRVRPQSMERAAFDPPPPVRFLMDRAREEPPFRVAGFDALRSHHTEMDNEWLFHFLAPNSATFFGLSSPEVFDPLAPLAHVRLVERLAGVAPFADPIRHVELARPSADLFRATAVRYLVGDPRDRRATIQPTALAPKAPEFELAATSLPAPDRATTHWGFVSLLDGVDAASLAPGERIATFAVLADEGRFEFPVRYGIETAHVGDAPEAIGAISPTRERVAEEAGPGEAAGEGRTSPTLAANMRWIERFSRRSASRNWRAWIDFGRPLHVRRAMWRLDRPAILFVAAQAYRLASEGDGDGRENGTPNRAGDECLVEGARWRRVFDHPVAPVWELLDATPLVERSGGRGAEARLERGGASIRFRASPGESVLARIYAAPGWTCRFDGRSVPVRARDGLFLEAGPFDWEAGPSDATDSGPADERSDGEVESELEGEFRYEPPGFGALLMGSILALALSLGAIWFELRRARERSLRANE